MGRVRVRTPRSSFERTNRDASPTARFAVELSPQCLATLLVGGRAVATRDGQAAQARRYTREADAVLASGERSRGSWILAEFSRRDPSTYEKTSERYLYGLAFVRLASRRWMHVRVIVTFTGTCAEADRRGRSFTAALARLLRTARVAARLVAKRPA